MRESLTDEGRLGDDILVEGFDDRGLGLELALLGDQRGVGELWNGRREDAGHEGETEDDEALHDDLVVIL